MKKNESELNRAMIMFVAPKLPKVSESAMDFLVAPFNYTIAFKRCGVRAGKAGLHWCAECGESFTLAELKDYRKNPRYNREDMLSSPRAYIATCPHCGMEMHIESWAYRQKKLEDIIGVRATMGEWEIDRYFTSTCFCKAGRQAEVSVHEIGQTWRKDGKEYHYTARIGGMYYSKHWKWYEPWHFANEGIECETWWDGTERHEMPADFSLDEELAMRGIELDKLHGLKLTQTLNYMRGDSHFETLWKQGDWEIAKFFKGELHYYWPQVRIARRNGYVIENLTEWKDYINLLRWHGKDDRNPKYICPDNLHDAHNAELTEAERIERIRQERWRRVQDELHRQQALKAMENRKKENEDYVKRRAKYFGICIPFGDGNSIVALKSIDEFEREGKVLNHCVFRCGYYSKSNSLILSARDKNGNPIETIEVDLMSFKILQCYGNHDTHTPLHDTIIKIMNENMSQVKQIRRLES